jgi:trehalose 6-phosphate phosphatase
MTDKSRMISKALEQISDWRRKREETGHLLLALDFDGTIAPIVKRPQDAYMLDSARLAIESLLKRSDTDIAIVSGRALDDLRERCGMSGVYYAGNHGLQIAGPGVNEVRAEALPMVPRVRAIAAELKDALIGIHGVYIEDKELTLSVHSRMIDDENVRERVHDTVRQIVGVAGNGIKLTYGKRVVEVRPDVAWHKGDATLFLLDRVTAARGSPLFPIYIGDDLTDEDAFVAMRGVGVGVLVAAELPAETAASAWVASPQEVEFVLNALANHDGD